MNNSKTAILSLYIVTFIASVSIIFDLNFFNQSEIDVYLFFDHKQYAVYIAEDVINRINLSVLMYGILILIPYKNLKRYARCFFWISISAIPYYFLFYSQYTSVVLLPALITSLIYTRWKNAKEGRNIR